MQQRVFSFVLLAMCALMLGCSSSSSSTAEVLNTGSCEFDSPSFSCTAERTTEGVAVTITNDIGVDLPSILFLIDQGACAQKQKVGALDDGRSATIIVRCIDKPLRAPMTLEYTLPSAYAGDPPRRTSGILSVP